MIHVLHHGGKGTTRVDINFCAIHANPIVLALIDSLRMTPASHVFATLRVNAPRLSREFFTCRQCLQKKLPTKLKPLSKGWTQPFHARFARAFNAKSTVLSSASATDSISSSPLASLSRKIGSGSSKLPRFPEVTEKIVAYWLLGSAASVFGIVVFGGWTRLTESGCAVLSISPPPAANSS